MGGTETKNPCARCALGISFWSMHQACGLSIYKIAFGDLVNGGIQQHHHNRIVILQDCLRRSCKWGDSTTPSQPAFGQVFCLSSIYKIAFGDLVNGGNRNKKSLRTLCAWDFFLVHASSLRLEHVP
jgi:hypothetical protein